ARQGVPGPSQGRPAVAGTGHSFRREDGRQRRLAVAARPGTHGERLAARGGRRGRGVGWPPRPRLCGPAPGLCHGYDGGS
ncbi:unnamed protein product, partial [Effrenium voratum]